MNSHTMQLETIHSDKKHNEPAGYELDKLHKKWPEYVKEQIHPSTFYFDPESLPDYYVRNNTTQTTAFAQYVRLQTDAGCSPAITITKPTKLPGQVVRWLSLLPKHIGGSPEHVEQIVRMEQFKLKHFRKFRQLTDREVEILKLLANGYNNPRIADRLFISRQTVETHRKNIKRKLKLRSFKDLMKYAFAFDLVEC